MIYSRNSQYAFRALAFLGAQEPGGVFPTAVIAKAQGVGVPSLAKVMKMLARAGMVKPSRGRRGGYVLVADPGKLSLWEVMLKFDDPALFSSCGIGLGVCDGRNPCALHPYWEKARGAIEGFLKGVRISDLAAAGQGNRGRRGRGGREPRRRVRS